MKQTKKRMDLKKKDEMLSVSEECRTFVVENSRIGA